MGGGSSNEMVCNILGLVLREQPPGHKLAAIGGVCVRKVWGSGGN